MKDNCKKLNVKQELIITPSLPFHLDSTFFKPAHFSSTDTKWEDNKRWQSMLWGGIRLGLIFENIESATKPQVLVSIYSENTLSNDYISRLKQELIWRYNLSLELDEFYKDISKESLLKEPIQKFKGLRPMHPGSLYEYLIIAIVLQNATVKRSINMMQVLFENYGTLIEFDNQKFWSFWEPKILAKANEQDLRNLKVGYRAKSLIKVSEPFASGDLDELILRNQTQDEQAKTLLSLYGIGPASVGYIMFDVFHHWDYLKHISPWEQKIYTKIFFDKDYEKSLVSVEKMIKFFNKWGKWKGLAVHYVWEDIWWKRQNQHIPWLEKLIRM
ncbi:hypothetical protein CO178_00620 [candidate division WWE3 bacterium CG_4_9_14_3_um_filter_34_6]|uniref:DNA-(apurinic or apyrimidinic site) lyase n=1 Tax=candidate division WWE3 bacterium CG_4_9_14_3_um_filter_34_6 TaxID=1975079 RepID=A0A2M7X549_UNCKA|nr:MAG: hypothetical protein CO178_00620 [candidate division WWE3 bacterium CG_4_9_14_3_um_filter_34_6]